MPDEYSLPIWPPLLPLHPLLDAYDEKFPSLLANVTTGNKSMIVRKIATRNQTVMSVSFSFNAEQMELFERFFMETLDGGTTRFTFTHPRKKTEIEVSFSPKGQTAFNIKPNGSMNYYKVGAEFIIWD